MKPKIDMIGQRYGRLTVTSFAGRRGRKLLYSCQCDCGNIATIMAMSLRNGDTQSCGCLNRERVKANKTKHGLSKTRTYNAWSGMKNRCLNTSDRAYSEWGGRGIRVCERWMSFENFLADMGEHPGPGYSIDRINNDGDYEPGNCRWATWSEQANNKRRNRNAIRYTVRGITGTITEVARHFGIHHNAVYMRLRRGASVEAAFTEPYQRQHRRRQRP